MSYFRVTDTATSRSLALLSIKIARFHAGDDHGPWSAFREFMEAFDEEMTVVERANAISARPRLTGSHRWDVFLGALGEHLAVANGFTMPGWVDEPNRYGIEDGLWEPLWSESGVAVEDCPPLFLARGILVAQEDFGMSVIASPYAGRTVCDMSDEDIEGLRRSVAMLTPGVAVTRELALGLFDEVQRLRQALGEQPQT
jgi:hypothetical protein